jgi:hypothetical protein
MEQNEGDRLESIPDIEETFDDEGNDTTDWKTLAFQRQELAKKYEGVAKRNLTDLTKLKREMEKAAETPPEKVEKKEKNEFDYAEMAYLEAKGIKEEEYDFILQEVKTTGKSLKDVLGFKYVQESLKGKRDEQAVKDATPSASKRGTVGTRDTVDYWLAKGELPPNTPENWELRKKVVSEKVNRQERKSKFTDNPIA